MKHLLEVRETYVVHLKFALWGSWQCFLAMCTLIVHAVIPPLFERSASTRLKSALKTMMDRYAS
jgi:hypothetical protein